MSIQYFYNFCLKDVDKTDLEGDLLTGIRKSFFLNRGRIKDKLTGNSEDQPLFYDFLIENEKPMKWLVKDASGATVQEAMLSDGGKYYIYFYEGKALYKRLLFSKYHTLLKAEYFETATGTLKYTLEPRKAQNGLCILYSVKTSAQPIPLFDAPEIFDEKLRQRIYDEFDDYTVIAATNDGLVRFLSDAQIASFNSLKEKIEQEIAQQGEESFVGGETPLLDKIKVNDFNVKRNLSSALDITLAMEFGVHDELEESPAEYASADRIASAEDSADGADVDETVLVDSYDPTEQSIEDLRRVDGASDEPVQDSDIAIEAVEAINAAVADQTVPDADAPQTPEMPAVPDSSAENGQDQQTVEAAASQPDKRIIADGAEYCYYGELDDNGNRSGFGRTMTDLNRIAYEGYYQNDKRSGKGSYFYKDGTLCYSGDWLENVRYGTGVGISSRDGSIHVGNWKNNKPDGNGVRLTAEGDIKFVCKTLSDDTTVLMHYLPDDTVVISKYDKFGMKLGDTTLSLKDLKI